MAGNFVTALIFVPSCVAVMLQNERYYLQVTELPVVILIIVVKGFGCAVRIGLQAV